MSKQNRKNMNHGLGFYSGALQENPRNTRQVHQRQ